MRAALDLVIQRRFQLVRRLGEGGMGVVWEATDLATGEPRAIKLVRHESTDGTAHVRFVREADALRGVAHRNVVKILEIARDDDGTPAIVMELLRGESLAARIEREKVLSVGQTCAILSRVTAAVASAHAAGIIHRDLKPDNVFVVIDDAGTVDVRVLDFGVAKKLESAPDKLTKTGTLIGTPFYMSPEQASGATDLDGKTDVWSLGVIAFECLTGKMPIRADNYGQLLMQIVLMNVAKLATVRPDLPKAIADAVDGALAARETRIDIEQLTHLLTTLADPTIAPPELVPPGPVRTQTALLVTPSAPDATAAPTIVDARPPPRPSALGPFLVGALSFLVLVGGGLAYGARMRRANIDPPVVTSATTTSSSPSPTAEPPSPASASPEASATATASTSIASTSKKLGPKPPGTAGSGPTPAPHASSTPTGRLQGGVGGDVPF